MKSQGDSNGTPKRLIKRSGFIGGGKAAIERKVRPGQSEGRPDPRYQPGWNPNPKGNTAAVLAATAFRKGIGDGDYPVKPDGRVRCVRTNRSGRRCVRYSMLGSNQCKRHGGKDWQRRLEAQSRYASFFASCPGLEAMFFKFLDDPDLTNLADEIALQRSLMGSLLALVSQSPMEMTKPGVASAITEINKTIALLADAQTRVDKRSDGWYSAAQVEWLCDTIVTCLADVTKDADLIHAVATAMEAIVVPPSDREIAAAIAEARASERLALGTGGEGGGEGRLRHGAESLPDGAGSSEQRTDG